MTPKKTLFLDRDGVINKKIENDYVKSISEWEWRDDFLSVIPKLSAHFSRIVIVTNQRGIALGKMTKYDLENIHLMMTKKIHSLGGKIDGIYYCPHDNKDHCNCRKPKIGLALQAQATFPDIEFKNAILIGDSESDIEMGNSLEMTTFLLSENTEVATKASKTISSLHNLF